MTLLEIARKQQEEWKTKPPCRKCPKSERVGNLLFCTATGKGILPQHEYLCLCRGERLKELGGMSMDYNKLPKDEPIKYVKLANPKLEHTENLWNGMPNYNIKYNIMAQVNNIADKSIYDAIIKYATEQGITDLFLIDEEFVKSALINELSRIAYENAEKEAKENGYIRVKLDLPKLPRTNFDRITESVESFIKWVLDTYHSVPEQIPCKASCNKDCGECFKEWLQKEIEE